MIKKWPISFPIFCVFFSLDLSHIFIVCPSFVSLGRIR